MKVGILTSSRADYGIYLPLLRLMKSDPFFDEEILVFGSHLSEKYGYTVRQIEADGFEISRQFNTAPENDSPSGIVQSMAKTMTAFSTLWDRETYDLIIALGDRYEMFSAVASALPFNIPVAHIHGGETTLGAIDNAFRHSITGMSDLHFASCEEYKIRVEEIKGSKDGIFNVGALSIDNLAGMKFLTLEEFYEKYNIDLRKPTILFTYHPETVSYRRNEEYIRTIIEVLGELKEYQIIITMPNADTSGILIRDYLNTFIKSHPDAIGVESFGTVGYLSCMKYCTLMLGNSSSGFVEASWFPKPVINIGDRQKGRVLTSNIITCPINATELLKAIKGIRSIPLVPNGNFYGDGDAAGEIVGILKQYSVNKR